MLHTVYRNGDPTHLQVMTGSVTVQQKRQVHVLHVQCMYVCMYVCMYLEITVTHDFIPPGLAMPMSKGGLVANVNFLYL